MDSPAVWADVAGRTHDLEAHPKVRLAYGQSSWGCVYILQCCAIHEEYVDRLYLTNTHSLIRDALPRRRVSNRTYKH